ncbi:hypothetical protein D3C85_1141540 [compost metagenome]
MHVLHAFELGITLQGDCVETGLGAHVDERSLQAGQRFKRGVRADELIVIEHRQAKDVLDRDDRIGKAPFGPGTRRALLAFYRVGIALLASEAMLGRQQVGTDALHHEVSLEGHLRVHRPGTAVGAHGDARHAFHAATDGQVDQATTDLGRGEVDRFKAGTTVAVDLHAGNGLRKIGIQCRDTGDVAALLAKGHDTPQDHILDQRGVEAIALAKCLQYLGRQLYRRDFVQGAVGLAFATRRAHVVIDVCISHRKNPCGNAPEAVVVFVVSRHRAERPTSSARTSKNLSR